MYYIGIDPGKSGAFAVIDENENIIFAESFVGLPQKLSALPKFETLVALERVHAMPGQGVVSMFTFAENYGSWQGFLTALELPYVFVTPQKWQKRILDFLPSKETKPIGETAAAGRARLALNRKNLKLNIVEFIKRRLPKSVDLFRLKKDYDKADALCLALYAKKFHLEA